VHTVLVSGSARRLVWGADESGTFRAKQHYESLDASDQAKFVPWFQRMAETGRITNTEKFRQEGKNLYAFKIFKQRLICFFDGRDVVLIHGFTKKADNSRRISRELKTAETLRDTYLQAKNKT
jgi:mRNA-degrading endonuclease RelE of RelBE toxin-antitoxin system